MFALIDCNNFYASCERIFNPSLVGKPVVVLSSNDGNVIARSEEAKALGISMAAPTFQIKHLIKNHDIQVFSSNFTLYGSIPNRVVEILESLSNHVEVYSIDESFIEISDKTSIEDYLTWGRATRAIILKWLGIPTRVGFGPTKTLAKLANHWAKTSPDGVFYVDQTYTDILQQTPVEEVWGIGRRISKRLDAHTIKTAYDFMEMSPTWIRQNFTVTGIRTASELKGIKCIELDELPDPQKNMVVSRSFGTLTTEFERLKEYVALFISRGAEKLRQKKLYTKEIGVFIRTPPFRKGPQYSNYCAVSLPDLTNDTNILIPAAIRALTAIYKPNFLYKKAGICFLDLCRSNDQFSLFEKGIDPSPSPLLLAMDKVNSRFGRHTVKFGACGLTNTKGIRSVARADMLSPKYTTSWEELAEVS